MRFTSFLTKNGGYPPLTASLLGVVASFVGFRIAWDRKLRVGSTDVVLLEKKVRTVLSQRK